MRFNICFDAFPFSLIFYNQPKNNDLRLWPAILLKFEIQSEKQKTKSVASSKLATRCPVRLQGLQTDDNRYDNDRAAIETLTITQTTLKQQITKQNHQLYKP